MMLQNDKIFTCIFIASMMLQTSFSDQATCLKYDKDKSCKENKVQFFLRTKEHEEHELNAKDIKSIQNARFKNGPIKFIIHGHHETKDDFIVAPIQKEYFKLGYNVIIIQYTDLSKNNCYRTGVENSRDIARCSTKIIEEIMNVHGIQLHNFHILGLSLGGQIAGQMPHCFTGGKRKFSRITGIDPANEGFYDEYDTDEYTLTEKDAEFVDVIHTNAGFTGKFRKMGHVDWYANWGIFQPGCRIGDNLCSHMRSAILFLESIGSPTTEVTSDKCDTLEMKFLTPQLCENNLKTSFGEYTTGETIEKGVYFFKTQPTPPYIRPAADTNYDVYEEHLDYSDHIQPL